MPNVCAGQLSRFLRNSYLRIWCLAVCSVALVTAAGCTVASPRGAPVPPSAEILPTDARTLAYGGTTAEVLQNPAMADKVRALFGPDLRDRPLADADDRVVAGWQRGVCHTVLSGWYSCTDVR